MNYAVVGSGGEVVNVVVLEDDSKWQPPEGHRLVECSDSGGIGWKVSGKKKWTEPKRDDPPKPAKEKDRRADEVGFDRTFQEGL